mmetsp:Transcript_2847/g.6618  ORF Transcript_2847/g.6618 Transcript_2847/m.6618 type:complete len:252 (+) Transcript_2847:116-871(+)
MFDFWFSSSARRGEYTSSTSLSIMFMCLSKAIRVPVSVPRTMLTYRTTIRTRFRPSRNRNRTEWGPESRCEAIASKGWFLSSSRGRFLVSFFPEEDDDGCGIVVVAVLFFRSCCNRWWLSRRSGSSLGKRVAHFPMLSKTVVVFVVAVAAAIHGLARNISSSEDLVSASTGLKLDDKKSTTPLRVSSGFNRYHDSSRFEALSISGDGSSLLLADDDNDAADSPSVAVVTTRSRTAVPYFFASFVASLRSPW